MIAISVLILVLTPGQGGHERFRVPAQPLLAILAAYGLAWTVLSLASCAQKRFCGRARLIVP